MVSATFPGQNAATYAVLTEDYLFNPIDVAPVLDIPDQYGMTGTTLAAALNPIILQQFITLGADPNLVDANGFTPAGSAAFTNNTQSLDVLQKAGVDLNEPDAHGFTPASYAASAGNAATLKHLKELGVDLSSVDAYGTSPAIYAAMNGDLDTLETLQDLGVDLSMPDANGNTPLETLQVNGYQYAAQELGEKQFKIAEEQNFTASPAAPRPNILG